mmetsp:Transcript_7578/g.20709  ORF Transcript_7578/g.20709 Transcript_7578/m.20709 type:complete len:271 (-) Transcript_7578:115-927(-)
MALPRLRGSDGPLPPSGSAARLVLLRHGRELGLNLRVRESHEFGVVGTYHAQLHIRSFQVSAHDALQAGEGGLHGLVVIVLRRGVGLDLLLEEVVCLLLLVPRGSCLVARKVARWVTAEELGRFRLALHVDPDDDERDAQWAHVGKLRVHLRQVGSAFGEGLHGHVVAVVELELRSLFTQGAHGGPRVGDDACGDHANGVRDLMHVCHGRRIVQLVRHLLLCRDARTVHSPHSHRCQATRLNGLEGVLYLVEPALGREDGDVPVIASCAS